MKYISCEKPGHFILKEKEPPNFKADEALLSIKSIGICGTDLHAYAGNQPFFTYPRILGHELAAEVEAIGAEVTNIKVGDKALIMPYISCGKCRACMKGKTNCCSQIEVLGVHTDGGMQEKFSVPASILLEVNDLQYEEIAIIEPLAIGAHAVRRANIQAGETVVVIGCGPIGLGIMKQAQYKGAKVIGVDVSDKRLAFAKSAMDIEHVVNAIKQKPESLRQMNDGFLADAVFDATGNRKAIEGGLDWMDHGGRFILVGLVNDTLNFHHPSIHAKESSIICSRNATLEDFEQVIAFLRQKKFPTSAYITHKVPFEKMIDHFEGWLDTEAGVIKAMVNF